MMQKKNSHTIAVEPSGMMSNAYRRLTRALSAFSDFDEFCVTLETAIAEDPYLSSELLLDCVESNETDGGLSVFKKGSVVVPLRGFGESNYIRVQGRRDGAAFGAQDLRLMGAIADFVSVLCLNSKASQKLKEQSHVLQYLINQLPLGVVCLDGSGEVFIENRVAQRLLGDEGAALIQAQVDQIGKGTSERIQMHFEVNGQLIYAEGRSLAVGEGVEVDAFVLYDLSASREKLLKDVELAAYMSESRGGSVVVALLESRACAGDVYQKIKEAATDFELEPSHIQPLDAYTCACVYQGKDLRSVRYLLRHRLACVGIEGIRASVVAYDSTALSVEPAKALVATAQVELLDSGSALLPELLVLDVYSPVIESLSLIVEDVCQVRAPQRWEEAESLIRSGQIDGLIFDLDGYGADALVRLQDAALAAGAGFKIFYSSYMQPQMAKTAFELPMDACLLQKPFAPAMVLDAVTLQFNLA
jgi:PAS domain-containing protein